MDVDVDVRMDELTIWLSLESYKKLYEGGGSTPIGVGSREGESGLESRCRPDVMGRPKVRKPRAAQRLLVSLLRFALQFKKSVLVGRHPGEPVARERRRRSNGAKGGQ